MATYAWDIPSYRQGHRFSQTSEFYDAANTRFLDRAGYTRFGNNHCGVAVGTPAFSNHGANSREGLLLDNSCQMQFLPAIPWQGTMLIVFKPTLVSAAVSIYPWLFGESGTSSSNGHLLLNRASAVNSIQCRTPAAVLSRSITGLTSGNITIAAFSISQVDRKIYSTQDGVTITATSAAAGTTSGEAVAIGGFRNSVITNRFCRLGANANSGSAANATDYLHLFEQHFWKGDVLNNSATKLQAFIASLKTYYGI